jgi:hypothetical protein
MIAEISLAFLRCIAPLICFLFFLLCVVRNCVLSFVRPSLELAASRSFRKHSHGISSAVVDTSSRETCQRLLLLLLVGILPCVFVQPTLTVDADASAWQGQSMYPGTDLSSLEHTQTLHAYGSSLVRNFPVWRRWQAEFALQVVGSKSADTQC